MQVKPPIPAPFLTSCDSKAEHKTGAHGGGCITAPFIRM